jgi:hypothetical protein
LESIIGKEKKLQINQTMSILKTATGHTGKIAKKSIKTVLFVTILSPLK